MDFDKVQATVKTRFDADSYFNGLSLVARKGFSAGFEAATDLKGDVDADLEANGLSFVIGIPTVDTVGSTRSGRAMLHVALNLDVIENADVNRGDGGPKIAPEVLALEVMQALLGHHEIEANPENCYRVMEDEANGLNIHRTSFIVESMIEPR